MSLMKELVKPVLVAVPVVVVPVAVLVVVPVAVLVVVPVHRDPYPLHLHPLFHGAHSPGRYHR